MELNKLLSNVRTDAEEIFFALGLEQEQGENLTKVVLKIKYDGEKRLHNQFIDSSNELIKKFPQFRIVHEARRRTHVSFVEELNNKIQAISLI